MIMHPILSQRCLVSFAITCFVVLWFDFPLLSTSLLFPARQKLLFNLSCVSSFMDGRNLEFSLLFIRTMINLIMQRQMFITYLCPFTPPQFTIFGLFHPVASVSTRFHCRRFLAPIFWIPFSSNTGIRIPWRSGFSYPATSSDGIHQSRYFRFYLWQNPNPWLLSFPKNDPG